MHDELTASEPVLSEGIPYIARDEPLRQCEAFVAQIEDFADRGPAPVTADQILRRDVLGSFGRLEDRRYRILVLLHIVQSVVEKDLDNPGSALA